MDPDRELEGIDLETLHERILQSERCPRLVEFRRWVAATKRRAYREWEYWGRPVPPFGRPDARLLIVGLAPAAHGGNRTGRIFTGDSSGDFLFETLYRFGFCSRPASRSRDDGLEMIDAYITAALHCAPPGNKPLKEELDNCRPFLRAELRLLEQVRVVVPLGKIAWDAYLKARSEIGRSVPYPRPTFRHQAEYRLDARTTLLGSYHPSRQNTQTGRLNREMLDGVFRKARELLDGSVILPP